MPLDVIETTDRTIGRVRCEFLEMPGLRLTAKQAQRLFGGEPASCQRALDALVHSRFLRITEDGYYAILSDSPVRHLKMRWNDD